jgi:hypothetical protein
MSAFVVSILKGVLLAVFIAVFIFTGIVHARMMRRHLERGSLFSPLQILRSMATRSFPLFILLVFVLAAIVAAMKALDGIVL